MVNAADGGHAAHGPHAPPGGAARDERRGAAAIDLRLPPDERAPGAARHVVAGILPYITHDLWEPLQLLVSELVTNSVLHAGLGPDDTVTVELVADTRCVRVMVRDAGPGIEPAADVRDPGPDAVGGWGLVLVDRLASRWGTLAGPLSAVWFELDLVDARPTRARSR